MYARCVRWLRPEDKTGAKLVCMHETVTSPKEYRSRHGLMAHGDAAVVEGSYADDGRALALRG